MKILLTALLLWWHFAIWKEKIKSDSTFNNFNVNLKSFYKITITKRFGIQKNGEKNYFSQLENAENEGLEQDYNYKTLRLKIENSYDDS
jgi:hypothetical protein